MWLTLDIGNSAVKGAFFDGARLVEPFRLELTRRDPVDAWEAVLRPYLHVQEPTRIGIASVVPDATTMVRAVLARHGLHEPLVLHHTLQLPFTLAYQTPHTLGIDRLAAAAAAWTLYGQAGPSPRSVVALDAGTAVNCEIIDRAGIYRGGTISAGPRLVRDALTQGTAQLPPIPLDLPHTPIGRSTQEALQAGILFTFIDGVRGLLHRIANALGEPPVVVATGGWSPFLQEHLDAVDHVAPHLVLQGIRVLMELNGKA